ncbi:uncharacterized protein KGF55_004979 [Candida pseudojiufengensis]|uniref:uncharacterized protein n=1 Tax=Candida pseudojiufengensis TaxID=497109 RepID=UPI00222570D1|nr:uncharacterized protein KGF55_004979 [Candida pseudojiufengensis]KAI5959747.1 hypothetical protein KGF55_004979 [Candida pseudojiufengensis]
MPSTVSTSNEWAKSERELALEQQLQEKIINEEFKIWKKSVPLLYDFIHTFALDYPSTVFQWLPTYNQVDDEKVEVKFVYSINSINKIENSLNVASITLPSSIIQPIDLTLPSIGINTSNFKVSSKWKQNSESNTIEISPDGKTILSFNRDGIIHGYNLDNDNVLDYKYHKQVGYTLNWIDDEKFLSGSNDSQIALWQRNKPSTPIQLFKTHHGAVNGISSSDKNIFGSVSDDSTTQLFDLRSSTDTNPIINVENNFIQNAIKFHPNIKNLYATGGKDSVINLYDLRNYKTPFRKLFGHNDSIKQIEWDWNNPSTIVSSGLDSRIIFWNLENLDEDFTYPDTSASNATTSTNNVTETRRRYQQANKIDPCLKYIHGGHVGRINDFAIHPKIKNLFASVGDDKLLEIWKPKTLSVEEEEEHDDDDDEPEQIEEEIAKETAAAQEDIEVDEEEEDKDEVGEEEINDKEENAEDIKLNQYEVKEDDESNENAKSEIANGAGIAKKEDIGKDQGDEIIATDDGDVEVKE